MNARAIAGAMCLWLVAAAAAQAEPAEAPAERLRRHLADAQARYGTLRDYRAVFYKTERKAEGLGPREQIFFKFRKPFKLFMKWLNTDKKGLQVLYERGKHDNKLAVHQPGLFFGLAQVVFLEQSSPYVREGSEAFNIEDAGIGTFLTDLSAAVEQAAKDGKLAVEEKEGVFDVTFPGTVDDDVYFAYRVRVGFDGPSGLPTRFELHDWQDRPIGSYEYAELKSDIGENDPEFREHINRRLYRVYAGS